MSWIILPSLLLLSPISSLSSMSTQTDWSGVEGVAGPVDDWGVDFHTENQCGNLDSPGDLCLAALRYAIESPVHSVSEICSSYLDTDDRIDLVYSSDSYLGGVYCLLNTLECWELIVVSDEYNYCEWIDIGDVDCDGDMDIIGCSRGSVGVAWFENDGSGHNWSTHEVWSELDSPTSIQVDDIDGDNDLDIALSLYTSYPYTDSLTLCWFENLDGFGETWEIDSLDFGMATYRSVCIGDIDSDGDKDIAVVNDETYSTEQCIYWYENELSINNGWVRHIADTTTVYAPYQIRLDNLNQTAELEIVYTCRTGGNDPTALRWLEFSPDGIWQRGSVADSVLVWLFELEDIDCDGDIDIISSPEWFENTGALLSEWPVHHYHQYLAVVETADTDLDGFPELFGYNNYDLSAVDLQEYVGLATLTSSILLLPESPYWDSIHWTSETSSETSISFQVRSNDCPYGMGLWSPVITQPGSVRDFLDDGDRYLQYKVILETANSFETPILNEVGFSWYSYQGQENSGEIEFTLSLTTNPSQSPVLLTAFSPTQQPVEVVVFSVDGRIAYRRNQIVDEGATLLTIGKLQPGVYICQIIAEKIKVNRRFTVVR